MTESWRDLPGGLYQVSSEGRVRRWGGPIGNRSRQGLILRQSANRRGYRIVSLYDATTGTSRAHTVHGLVARAFVRNPDHGDQVNHIDGDKSNNRAANLEWTTGAGNKLHAVANGLVARGEAGGRAKLTENDVLAARAARSTGETLESIASRFGAVRLSTLHAAIVGKTWRHLPGAQPLTRPHREYTARFDAEQERTLNGDA